MSEPNQSLEEFLFEAALAKSSDAERAAFLGGVCRDNPALRARLNILLEGHFQAEGFLTAGSREVEKAPAPPPPEDEASSAIVGRYKLLERIGEGGFGEVWMAGQREPVKRRVALKIIKLGMDTKQVVARFEAERQALAVMDHPSIAKVFDAGATDTGRPYFVMELVRGVRITEYCDRNRLPTQDRLKLFVQVCRAIQHAHQKGIIHRDIKPSNILVTLHDGVPVPKVIDFGIAKATQVELTDKTVFTQFHQFLGTPAYVSPEQAEMSGLDIDTRSDIYSLGVLLYELLTGKTPFDTTELLAAGLDELRRRIREIEPVRPSTRLSGMTREELTTTAQRRGAEAPKLISLVRGDLDWIVMKCLEKDRARRYETANGVARDIERHLGNEPVLARPPSRLYEFQKTVRRHWVGFAAVAAVLMALGIGVVVSTVEAVRARRAEWEQSRLRTASQRAELSEAKQKASAQQLLYDSLVGEARATRLARQVGYRDKVFALLKQAMALDVPAKSLADLRQEAVSCLGDFVGLTPMTFTNFPAGQNELAASLDGDGKLAALWGYDGTIRLVAMPLGKELARLPCTNGIVRASRFNTTGDQLFAVAGPTNPTTGFVVVPRIPLSNPWVYSWSRGPDGRWRETRNGQLPGATLGLFSTAAGVFDVTLSVDSTEASDPSRHCARFRLFNLSTGGSVPGYEVIHPCAPAGDINFCVSRDGQLLAVESTDSDSPTDSPIVSLYRWSSGERLSQLRLPNGERLGFGGNQPARSIFYRGAGPLVFSDTGKYLFDLSGDGGTIYAVPGLERMAQLRENLYPGSVQVFGNLVALRVHMRQCIELLDWTTQKEIALLDEPAESFPAAFSANGESLLTTGERHARWYRFLTPEKLEVSAHASIVPGAAFSPDGLCLASVSKDRVVCVCDALSGHINWETNDLPGLGQCVSFSPDGRWLVIGFWDSDLVWIRDAKTGERLLELGEGQAGNGYSAQVSPDGRYLATAGDNATGVRIWSIEHHRTEASKGALQARLVKSWPGIGGGLAFAPDSHSVTFMGTDHRSRELWNQPDRSLYVWDFEASMEPRHLAYHIVGWAQCLGLTPDGRQVIAMDANGEILTADVTTGDLVSSCHAEDLLASAATEVQPSPDGSRLAVASALSSGSGVSILDPKTGRHLYSLPAESAGVYWLAWSPDSRRLAVARGNGNIAIWDLEKVEQILTQLGLNP